VTEHLTLVAFLERLAARPIPQLSMGDKDRLHDAALVLRHLSERQRKSEGARDRYVSRPRPTKANRVPQDGELEGEGAEP
jgi:hypothetical protein